MPLPDEDLSEIRHSPTALGPASGLKCSAWAIALDRPGDCNVARRGLCGAKRRRSQERARRRWPSERSTSPPRST